MAYETGVAQNERDLLDKLNKFLTTNATLVANGQAWTNIFDRTLPETATQKAQRQVAWKATGTGVEQDIYLTAASVNLIASDTYNLNFYGGTYFNAQQVTESDVSKGLVNPSNGVALFGDSRQFEYHFIANGRCCKVVTRIEQICSTAYLGFILPTVPPIEYPYPLCVAGSAPTVDDNKKAVMVRYSDTTKKHSSIVDAKYGNCWLFTPDQAWRDFNGSAYTLITSDSRYQRLYPLNIMEEYSSYAQPFVLKTLGSSPGGANPLIPVEFVSMASSSQGVNRWGCFDGVYWVPGLQRATGDKVKINDDRTGLVFNSGFRTTTTDYFVIETMTEY